MENTLDTSVEAVTAIIEEVSGVGNLAPDQDFYEAGVTSVLALPLLMELESRFGVTIPDDQFVEARTPRALQQMLNALAGAAAE